jgi:hypothetical protein
MVRLVEGLEDWSAVRLGALGPVRAEAAAVLHRKRVGFLLDAVERYGPHRGEVFALFILHSAFDDEVRALLQHLADDKLLTQTLGGMTAVEAELHGRGLKLEDFPERGEKPRDVLRGLARAGRDALATSPMSDGARYMDFTFKRAQLPPPYQQALDEVERGLMQQRLMPGRTVLGMVDHLTFGVPLGFHSLVTGTAQGVSSLTKGQYEEATRQLAPAALLVALYAGGKGMRAVTLPREGAGGGLKAPQRLTALSEVAERMRARLGTEGVNELARHLQARREGALLVAEGGEAAALALHQARGDVVKARALLSQARPSPPAPAVHPALEAKLLQAELELSGPRLPADVALLRSQRPSVEAPPPGVAKGSLMWTRYVAYRESRLAELERRQPVGGPLRWDAYQRMWGQFNRGLAFEKSMVALLRADASLPPTQRRWLQDFTQPLIETTVGVAKPGQSGLYFADALVIERKPPLGLPPRVESFSFKSRDFSLVEQKALEARLIEDAGAALRFYGGTLDVRRPALRQHLGASVQVQRVRLVYEGGQLRPRKANWGAAVDVAQAEVLSVEVLMP